MTASIASISVTSRATETADRAAAWTRYLVPAGRALFALIFISASAGHFAPQTIGYAAQQGVPLAGVLVPVSGLIGLAGGLSVLLGYRARIGAGLLVLFLLGVTPLHNFWSVSDPMMAQMQMAMFMKNLSMLGGALLVAYWGAGPVSLDARESGSVGIQLTR